MYLQQGKQRTGTDEKVAASPLQPHQRVDQHTGDRHANPPLRGQNPEGEAAQSQKRKQGGNSTTVTIQPPTPCETITAGVEQPTWVSQQGNPRRAASCMTPRVKTAGVPRQAEQTHQGGSARADVTPSRRRKKIQHRCYRNKILPRQKQQGHQRRWAAAQTPKVGHQRREREENRQAEQRRQHQKGRPGIKAKIPKMIRN